MNEQRLRQLFPNASRSTLEANINCPELSESEKRARRLEDLVVVGSPKLERHSPVGAVGAPEAQGRHSARVLVRVTSIRRRLIDEDNLCEKYVLDCCRYAGLIPDDSPSEVRIEARQRKVEKGEVEHTLIEVFDL